MGRALKCDICGTYFDYDSKYIGIAINRYNRYDTEMVRKEKTLLEPADMCPDCYNAIMATIDDRRKVHHMEDEAEEDNGDDCVIDTYGYSEGKWIPGKYTDDDKRYNDYSYKCNRCGRIVDYEERVCPCCGARMYKE